MGGLVLSLVRIAFPVEDNVLLFRGTSSGLGAGVKAEDTWGRGELRVSLAETVPSPSSGCSLL